MNNKGYTLVEMLVAISIFSILLVAIMNTFVRGFYYQKRILEMQAVQREESYLMEMMSREIRMATAITVNNLDGATELNFTDHTNGTARYCLSDTSGACNPSGRSFSINGQVVNSEDVEISGLKFFTSETFTDTQPLVTIVMQVESKRDSGAKATLQTSIAMRLYK
jgi:prepilin-type N-terminal cleavage/methylation domain-containing protein